MNDVDTESIANDVVMHFTTFFVDDTGEMSGIISYTSILGKEGKDQSIISKFMK